MSELASRPGPADPKPSHDPIDELRRQIEETADLAVQEQMRGHEARITEETDTQKRPAAARRLMPPSTAASARPLKSMESGLPIPSPRYLHREDEIRLRQPWEFPQRFILIGQRSSIRHYGRGADVHRACEPMSGSPRIRTLAASERSTAVCGQAKPELGTNSNFGVDSDLASHQFNEFL